MAVQVIYCNCLYCCFMYLPQIIYLYILSTLVSFLLAAAFPTSFFNWWQLSRWWKTIFLVNEWTKCSILSYTFKYIQAVRKNATSYGPVQTLMDCGRLSAAVASHEFHTSPHRPPDLTCKTTAGATVSRWLEFPSSLRSSSFLSYLASASSRTNCIKRCV